MLWFWKKWDRRKNSILRIFLYFYLVLRYFRNERVCFRECTIFSNASINSAHSTSSFSIKRLLSFTTLSTAVLLSSSRALLLLLNIFKRGVQRKFAHIANSVKFKHTDIIIIIKRPTKLASSWREWKLSQKSQTLFLTYANVIISF